METVDKINIEILEKSKEFFSDLLGIILCGSAGKNKFIENWSDLDYIIITKTTNLLKIQEFLNYFSSCKIHIGTTFFTQNELAKMLIPQRCIITFYEISNGKNKILFQEQTLKLPIVSIEDVCQNYKSELAKTIISVKRSNYNEFRPLFKKLVLIKKLLLEAQSVIKYDFKEIDIAIKQFYPKDKVSLCELFNRRRELSVCQLYSIINNYLIDMDL